MKQDSALRRQMIIDAAEIELEMLRSPERVAARILELETTIDATVRTSGDNNGEEK